MRPLAFDRHDALNKATDLFWSKGFEATSVDDLCGAMGIARSSFYNSFGSKQDLLAESMTDYARNTERTLTELFDTVRPVQAALRTFLERMVDAAQDPGSCRGCLIGNMAAELTPRGEAQRKLVAERARIVEAAMQAGLEAGVARGELAADTSPEALARYVFATAQAVQLMSKLRPDRAALTDVIDTAMSAIR